MKLNKITLSLAAVAAMSMMSCSEGQYWDEASKAVEVYAFAKPAETVSVAADAAFPTSYDIIVSRSTSGKGVTVPVTFTASSPLLSGPSEVTFEDGSMEAVYTISVGTGTRAGITYSAKLELAQPEDAEIMVKEANLVCNFKISQVLILNWVDAGTANTISQWAGNEDPIAIPIQECDNDPTTPEGTHLMRLVSPYAYLEPDFAEKGADILFYVDDAGDAVDMYSAWQYMGEYDEEEGYFYFGCPAEYGAQFINQGNIYAMAGIVGTAEKLGGAVSPGWYETLQFQWVK
ncbi:MAG: hypothetical protein K2J82_05515 [Muribaculaceae bacterium]|nr:hypothetical protein [Muribaculaceae bacterium]MDE6754057.1 hypothetical protein [Muribaculaceae bacterium]